MCLLHAIKHCSFLKFSQLMYIRGKCIKPHLDSPQRIQIPVFLLLDEISY
jgi:hypothetical protein